MRDSRVQPRGRQVLTHRRNNNFLHAVYYEAELILDGFYRSRFQHAKSTRRKYVGKGKSLRKPREASWSADFSPPPPRDGFDPPRELRL